MRRLSINYDFISFLYAWPAAIRMTQNSLWGTSPVDGVFTRPFFPEEAAVEGLLFAGVVVLFPDVIEVPVPLDVCLFVMVKPCAADPSTLEV